MSIIRLWFTRGWRDEVLRADLTALLIERGEHNRDFTRRHAVLGLVASAALLAQHVIAPSPANPYGSTVWYALTTVYAAGCVLAAGMLAIAAQSVRWAPRATNRFSILAAITFLIASNAISVASSSVIVNMSALALASIVVAALLRAPIRLSGAMISVSVALFALARWMVWREFSSVAVVVGAVVIFFSVYVARTTESARLAAFVNGRELDRRNQALAELSSIDPLTKLLNRRTLEEHLVRHFEMFTRYGLGFSIIFLDIDHFKSINDSYGHDVGDEVLRFIAGVLRDALRATDEVARYGGEEFVVVMPHTDADGAYEVAQRLRATIEAGMVGSQGIHCTASLGVSEVLQHDRSFGAVMHRADQALYVAKRRGRNEVVATLADAGTAET